MTGSVMAMMISISIFLGALGLVALIWGIKTGQFNDPSKFIDGARFDTEEELKDAIKLEEKKRKAKEKTKQKKRYMPMD